MNHASIIKHVKMNNSLVENINLITSNYVNTIPPKSLIVQNQNIMCINKMVL